MLVNHRESEQNTGLNNIPCNETQDKEARRQSSKNNISSDACNEDDNSSIVRRRGPNRGSQIPSNGDERTNIHVVMNKFIEIEVVRDITTDIKGSIKEAWPTWKNVPNDSKNLLWGNFKLRYKWDNLTDREMKKVWNKNAGEGYRSAIHLAKKEALSLSHEELEREPTMLDIIGRGPEWMDAEIWSNLVINHWNKEDHKKKCDVARNNRMTMKYGSITRHAGGSIPFGTHRERMEKELGRDVDDFEVFERTHKKKARY
ncbi:uncharacterized protein [Henckelia pumila]|uniref:uncharacterized protein isoform X1 n=1 Tax=Henckelia pumila TaxID=405737 RepID=UPI003C6DDAE9